MIDTASELGTALGVNVPFPKVIAVVGVQVNVWGSRVIVTEVGVIQGFSE